MLSTAARWESRRIRSRALGGTGLVSMLLLALLFLAPWQRIGFATALEGVVLFTWVFTIVVAANIGSESGDLSDAAFWLYQKGIAVADYALAKWLVACVWSGGLVLVGVLLGGTGLMLHGEMNGRSAVMLALSGLLLLVIVLALYFLGGAARIKLKTEILLTLALLAMLQKLLFGSLPVPARSIVHVMLPPLEHAGGVPSALLAGQWTHALTGLIHIVLFVSACLAGASMLHRRWRPFV